MLKKIGITVFSLFFTARLYAGPTPDSVPDEVINNLLNVDQSVMLPRVWKVRGTPQARPILKRLIIELQSEDRDRRNLAACAITQLGPYGGKENVADALRALLKRDPEGISPCATQGAVESEDLEITLREAPPLLRVNSNWYRYTEGPLAKIGEPVVPLLVETLADRDVLKKHMAIHVLTKMGPKAIGAVAPLKALLQDKHFDTDVIAATALLHIVPDDPDALKVLIQSLDQNRGNAYWVVTELEKKKDLPEVQRVLNAALDNKDPAVNRAAANALGKAPRLSTTERWPILGWLMKMTFLGLIYIYVLLPLLTCLIAALICGWASFKYQERRGSRTGTVYLSISAVTGVAFALAVAYVLLVRATNHFHI